MKKMLIAGLICLVAACSSYAKTVTNMGQVITVTTYEDVAAAVADTDVWNDPSDYPDSVGDRGTIIRRFKYDVDRFNLTTNTVTTLQLDGSYLLKTNAIPDGFVICGGFLQVLQAFDTDYITNMYLGANSAADIFGADGDTNRLNAVGVYNIDTTSWATMVTLTNDRPITFGIEATPSATITNGMFILVLDGYLSVPGQ